MLLWNQIGRNAKHMNKNLWNAYQSLEKNIQAQIDSMWNIRRTQVIEEFMQEHRGEDWLREQMKAVKNDELAMIRRVLLLITCGPYQDHDEGIKKDLHKVVVKICNITEK
jgi:vacuolar-type H+-ATPase catalytic subunit A/Vma1